jgi:hypothetical protein
MDGVFSNYTDLALASRAAFLTAAVPEPETWAIVRDGTRRRSASSPVGVQALPLPEPPRSPGREPRTEVVPMFCTVGTA